VGKFDKNAACAYCEKEMVSINRNKKFCSDKCRIYFRRENVKLIDQKNRQAESDLAQMPVKKVAELPKNSNELSAFDKYRNKKLGI
jgi:hypothetical protein